MQAVNTHQEADMSLIEACDKWVKVNGKLTHKNFLDCYSDVLQDIEQTDDFRRWELKKDTYKVS